MNKQNHVNFVTVVLFFGMIATFMIYFGMSTLLDHGEKPETLEQSINEAVYENGHLDEIITFLNFRIFKQVDNENVIVGSDGFLFERVNEETGYGYLLDYRGDLAYTESELERIKDNIETRRAAYENMGSEYLLVVIPNSQTVYSENMPEYFGKISDKTRLSMLTNYLEEQGMDCFFNAKDALIAAKSSGLQYNNTENSLNALGAYTVYGAVLDRLGDSLPENCGISESIDFYSHLDSGKSTARSAGLQNLVFNRTVSLSSLPQTVYSAGGEYENLEITKIGGESASGDVSVMLEFYGEWSRIILRPYFSNTFSTVAYKANHMFSSFANEETSPDVVIQLIYEHELSSLTDEAIAMTYGAGFEPEGTLLRTPSPTVLGSCYIDEDTVCIFGDVEKKSTLTVTGQGIEPFSQAASSGRFYIAVDIPKGAQEVTLELTAKYGAKKPSDPITLIVTKNPNAIEKNIAVGKNSHLFATQYSLNTSVGVEGLHNTLLKDLSLPRINELTGKETKYVYVIIPTKLTADKASAPENLLEVLAQLEIIKETAQGLEEFGINVIDLTDAIVAAAKREELYLYTESIPNAAGSYIAYRALAATLGFPNIISRTELRPFDKIIPGGSLVSGLGLDTTVVSENTQALEYGDSGVTFSFPGLPDLNGKYSTQNKNTELPTAIIMHDEYGTQTAIYLAECFSQAIVYATDDMRLDAQDLTELKPDYIIKIVGEENITN